MENCSKKSHARVKVTATREDGTEIVRKIALCTKHLKRAMNEIITARIKSEE